MVFDLKNSFSNGTICDNFVLLSEQVVIVYAKMIVKVNEKIINFFSRCNVVDNLIMITILTFLNICTYLTRTRIVRLKLRQPEKKQATARAPHQMHASIYHTRRTRAVWLIPPRTDAQTLGARITQAKRTT